MKIVMLCDFYDEKSQYQENLLGKYYIKNGHSVTILAATFDSAFDYYLNKYNKNNPGKSYYDGRVKVIKLPYSLNFLNKLRKFGGVESILNKEKPDLIYLHGIHLNIKEAVNYIRKNQDCKMIMDFHGDYSNSAKNWLSLNILHKVIRKLILYSGIKYISRIYSVVPAGFDFLHEVYGISYSKIDLLPLGADTDTSKKIMLAREGIAIRKLYNIPEEAIVIFTGGKFTPAKKTDILIQAFIKILNPNLHLMIVGDAGEGNLDYKNQLLKLCDGNNNIHFVGWVNGTDIYKYMDACNLAVFPGSQSVLWQQSLSMGLPLIVGKVGIQDSSYMNLYNNMIIIEEKNINDEVIAEKIKEIIKNKITLINFKNAALKATDELLNYDKIILKTLDFDR